MFDSLRPYGLHSPRNSPGQNTGVGSLSLLQGIFPTQGSNPGLPHCRRILYRLSHQGSPVLTVLHNNCITPLCAWPCFFHFPGLLILRALTNHLPTGESPSPRPFPRERLQLPGPTCAQRGMASFGHILEDEGQPRP